MAVDKSKKLNIEELDGVAGGTILETLSDSAQLYKRGLLENEFESCAAVRDKLHGLGYSGYEDKGGLLKANVYTDKQGKTITREEFWKNFDKENGTKVIR
jgi:hypothetical protein